MATPFFIIVLELWLFGFTVHWDVLERECHIDTDIFSQYASSTAM